MLLSHALRGLRSELHRILPVRVSGHVTAVHGLTVHIGGMEAYPSLGSRLCVQAHDGRDVLCEVTAVHREDVVAMPFSTLDSIGHGSPVRLIQHHAVVYPHESWQGRTLNALGAPIDGLGPLINGEAPYPVRHAPPPAHTRQRVGGKLDMGVRAVNTFVTCCRGQRLGIFAGSGIGKSVLMSMFVRYAEAPVTVIGLIGERGREVQEFIQDDLGEEGLKKSVVVVSTSDESALMRREAAYMTLTIAEYFRDQGKDVLCLMDSVTRFAMAQREIGLSTGELPATKGYTPTVFAELPKLLERAGPGAHQGTITGLFTVLVEGDNHNEPVADAVRGILDGHLVLSRDIAHRGRYPAIDVLKSVSRTMPDCNEPFENEVVKRAQGLLSTYEDMADLIRLGAYKEGSSPDVDEAVHYYKKIEDFLAQDKKEHSSLEEGYKTLAALLDMSQSST